MGSSKFTVGFPAHSYSSHILHQQYDGNSLTVVSVTSLPVAHGAHTCTTAVVLIVLFTGDHS